MGSYISFWSHKQCCSGRSCTRILMYFGIFNYTPESLHKFILLPTVYEYTCFTISSTIDDFKLKKFFQLKNKMVSY